MRSGPADHPVPIVKGLELPVRPVYRSYPIYHPDREPAGYQQWLRDREPENDAATSAARQWRFAQGTTPSGVFEVALRFNLRCPGR